MKISVCIPIYGAEKHIEQCVRTLFGQTLDSLEYVFIDDCSPDKSIEIMQKVLEEYPNRKEQVKLIRHETNQGVGAARNRGVAACTGEYIIHCDSDDWIDLDMYEKMYAKAKETNADMIECSFILEGQKNEVLVAKELNVMQKFNQEFYSRSFNSLCNKMFRRSMDHDLIVPDHICMGEDFLRVSQMLSKCKIIQATPDIYYHYRQTDGSLVHKWKRKHYEDLRDIYYILRKVLPMDKKICLSSLSCALFLKILFHYGDLPDDNEFFKKDLTELQRYSNLYPIIKNRRIRPLFKFLYVCGVCNFFITSKILHFLNNNLNLNR